MSWLDNQVSRSNKKHENWLDENSMLNKFSILGNNTTNVGYTSSLPKFSINGNPIPFAKKSVYFSESGAVGGDVYTDFRDCQAGTDEKIDNMRFGFTGIAGFNKWHYNEGNQYSVWESHVRAEQHMNGQDVKNVIGSDYIQRRQAITLDFTNELDNDEGQVLEMQYYLSEDKNSAVGYVYNRTVNYRTAGGDSQCRSSPYDLTDDNFNYVVNFDWNSDDYVYRTEIIDLPNHEDYLFDFYSYPDGEYLSSVTENTGFNDEIRLKFPQNIQLLEMG